MEILVINGDCIQFNSSANLCHLAYICGLVDSGHNVTLLTASANHHKVDSTMKIPSAVKHHTIDGLSIYQRLSLSKTKTSSTTIVAPSSENPNGRNVSRIAGKLKHFILSLYGPHGIYSTFVRKAMKFRSSTIYDYVISLSTPPSSHLLAHNLLKAGHIKATHWIQIWEDPWHNDVYGFNSNDKIRREEQRLLSFAEKVCYVSPLTLKNQQEKYPESAHKMYWQPLPFYYSSEAIDPNSFHRNQYGYFGDYAPAARNLAPFYEAAKRTGIQVNICGNPSSLFPSTEQIHIHPRLPLDKLKPIEDSTNVLVFLCNRRGGQIPGKIYQYSATNKTILFIMDGTEEEQAVLRDYFGSFNRYVFCQNTPEDITRAIRQIESGELGAVRNEPLKNFAPTVTIENILKAGS